MQQYPEVLSKTICEYNSGKQRKYNSTYLKHLKFIEIQFQNCIRGYIFGFIDFIKGIKAQSNGEYISTIRKGYCRKQFRIHICILVIPWLWVRRKMTNQTLLPAGQGVHLIDQHSVQDLHSNY